MVTVRIFFGSVEAAEDVEGAGDEAGFADCGVAAKDGAFCCGNGALGGACAVMPFDRTTRGGGAWRLGGD